MYHSATTLTSTSSPIYNLPHSSLGPRPSSSTYRYGSSLASYTEPLPARWLALPVQASSLSLQPGSRTLLAKKSAGSAAPSACTQSACTAMHPAHILTFQGSDAPMSMVDEDPTQGSHALEDWWSQVRVHPEDLPRQASSQIRSLPGFPVPSQSYSTHSGYALMGTDLLSRGTVCNTTIPITQLLLLHPRLITLPPRAMERV